MGGNRFDGIHFVDGFGNERTDILNLCDFCQKKKKELCTKEERTISYLVLNIFVVQILVQFFLVTVIFLVIFCEREIHFCGLNPIKVIFLK